MGFIWQQTGSKNKDLEGIMELVDFMENELRCGLRGKTVAEQESDEEKEMLLPVNRKEFKLAFQNLQESLQGLIEF
eukprot:7112194-Heterocapsa_arctica.AAC.1